MKAAEPGTSSPQEKNHIRFTLWAYLVLVFASLLIVTAAAVTLYTYESNRDATVELSGDLIKHVNKAVIEKTNNYMKPLMVSAELISKQVERRSFGLDRDRLIKFLLDLLDAHPDFYSVYVGYGDGSFVQTINRRSPLLSRIQCMEGEIPQGTNKIVRILSRENIPATETWTHLDPSGNAIATTNSDATCYDPRKRAWYQGAEKARRPYWTDPYVFFSLKRPGITASVPIFDDAKRLHVVAAADFSLDRLSNFLKKQKIGKSGVAFIVNSRKQLVAYPDIEQVVKRDEAGKPVIGMIDDVNDKNVRAAIREFWSTRKSDIEVEVDGRLMIGTFSPMPAIVGKKWIIGIVVPADDFLGPVKETSRTALMISAGLLLAGVIAIGLVSKTVSRPVRQLAGETRKIRDFDLDDDIDVRSRIAEPYELANSLATMKTAIRSFSKFAPRALVRQLIESGEGVELGGHKHDLTVMFTDIQGFTGISENMDPEEVMLHVSEYFEELTDIIRSNRGTIDKFIGDSIMAFWGAPVNDDEHPFKAVRAALQCDKRLEHLNEKWAANDKPPMITRFGLHSGEMIVGNFGSLERLNYTVLGDAVNLASRLEGINKVYGTRICISDDLYHRIRERYLTRPLDIVAVEGRQQGTIIHELCASRFDDPEIGATDKQIELCAKTAAGFDFYVNRQWDEAIRIYESIANNFPKDRVTQIFIMRCQGYRENPPGDSWPEIP